MLLPSLTDYLPPLLPPLQYDHVGTLLSQAGTLCVAQVENDVGSLVAAPSIFDNLLSTLDASDHPTTTILASYCLVTASDMIPFLPCQPLAVALGAKLGFELAFPITAVGQATAGVLAFSAARRLSNSQITKQAVSTKLSPEAVQRLQEFRHMTDTEEQGDAKILLALVGLRLAPFFPFSAGNYLLGGTTSVPLRLFVIATLFGCLLSNFVSVSVGAGGAMLFANEFHL
mmetsp:Transcript_6660/g.11630  ORF Transcript_6660/g.11630 Transcript_6660/m.11630 type:complete len:229 (+) Transcript_6660:85-771(+)